MPTLRRFDFQLGGKGFLLARGQFKGRSWQRSGAPDTPSRRSDADTKYGVLPDTLDHPTVWDDFSGGYGHPYRRNGENTYHWGENFDARFPRQLVHAQNVKVAKTTVSSVGGFYNFYEAVEGIADMDGRMLILKGPDAMVAYFSPTNLIDYGGNDFLGSGYFLHNAAVYGSYIWFGGYALNAANKNCFYGSALPVGAAGVTASGMPGYRFAVAGNQLWRSHGVDPDHGYYLQNCGNPAGVASPANWGATYNIGNYRSAIKSLTTMDDQVFAGTDHGLFAGDQTGTFVNVLSELKNQTHPDNCRDLTIHDGAIIVPHIAGLFSYKPGLYEAPIEDISPPRADRSPVHGRIRSVRGYGRWLYAGLYTGSQSWLLSGERRPQGMAWHTLQRFPHQAKVSRLHVDGITTASDGTRIPNHMWAAMDASIDTSGTAPLYWWPIPSLDGNPLSPSPAFSANYIGSARMDLGNVDWGAPGTPKGYREVEVWADMLLSGYRYCDVYYDLDQSGSFALLGRAQDSPKSVLYFPAGEGSWVTGQSIELSLRSFTASPAYTPIYRSIALRGALLPNSIDQITAVVQIADNLTDRQGGKMRSGATMIKELRDFAAQQTPTTLIDLVGAHSYVSVIPPVEEQEVYQSSDSDPEIAATVRMAVMTFS